MQQIGVQQGLDPIQSNDQELQGIPIQYSFLRIVVKPPAPETVALEPAFLKTRSMLDAGTSALRAEGSEMSLFTHP
jgi:hypothetical protein